MNNNILITNELKNKILAHRKIKNEGSIGKDNDFQSKLNELIQNCYNMQWNDNLDRMRVLDLLIDCVIHNDTITLLNNLKAVELLLELES